MQTTIKQNELWDKQLHGWGENEIPYHLSNHPPTPKWNQKEIEKSRKEKEELINKHWRIS